MPNNNSQNCRNKNEDASGATESEKRLCPGGCGVYVPVDSSVFKIHIKETHRMDLGPGWNWFLKRHPTMPKQGEKNQKLVKCGGCGTVYKELEDLRKCQAKHSIAQIGKKKEQRGETKEKTPPPVVSNERLRCDFPGCKDKKGFLSKDTLSKHQRKSHNLYRAGEESGNFICPFCDKGFHSSWNRARHVPGCQENPDKDQTTQGPSSSLPSARANNGETSPPDSRSSANSVAPIFRSQHSSTAQDQQPTVWQSNITNTVANVPMSQHSQSAPGQTPVERQSSNFPMFQHGLIFPSQQQAGPQNRGAYNVASLQHTQHSLVSDNRGNLAQASIARASISSLEPQQINDQISRYDGNSESEMSLSQKSTEGMLL